MALASTVRGGVVALATAIPPSASSVPTIASVETWEIEE
jgi:hypothetical protein